MSEKPENGMLKTRCYSGDWPTVFVPWPTLLSLSQVERGRTNVILTRPKPVSKTKR
jgi:hypothetical protein